MKKLILGLVIVSFLGMVFILDSLAGELAWQEIGGGNLKVKTVLIDPRDSRRLYLGSKSGVFKSEDGGASWRNILSMHGENRGVNFLAADPQNYHFLYAACGGGLYHSSNQGATWKRIFKGRNAFENTGTTVAVISGAIYLGTKGGLFRSDDGGRSWHKESGLLGSSHILAIANNIKKSDHIYIACLEGVFRINAQDQGRERIFIAQPTEDNGDKEDSFEDGEEEKASNIRYLSIDPNNSNYLYLAGAKGIYKSLDRGETWELFSDYGLLSPEVKFLLVSQKSQLFCVTKSGIFEFRNERWHELSLNLAAQVNSLGLDNQGNLYAASDKGLFKAIVADPRNNISGNRIAVYYENEPKIKEVQQAAIKYAEVDPKKILRWRKQAAKKAYLPRVSASVGRNITDLWHWETGSSARNGDDLLIKGNEAIEWDITLSWDLSEIIWTDAQTSIDTRSRLMVQLRQDVLDEVTKLYFERIRVKMELDNLAIEDRKKRLEKELKIEELSASLDALTGGYFSQQNIH